MTDTTPPPAARTPGHAALWRLAADAFYAADGHPLTSEDLDGFSDDMRTRWEAAAQSAIAAAPAVPENSWAEAFHDDAAEARAEVQRLRERVTGLEAANAALVLARPDALHDVRFDELATLRAAVREIGGAMNAYDTGNMSGPDLLHLIDATLGGVDDLKDQP